MSWIQKSGQNQNQIESDEAAWKADIARKTGFSFKHAASGKSLRRGGVDN